MTKPITKENYRTLTWDKNITFEQYDNFINALPNDEKTEVLKFILENYPNYDEEWIEIYFEIADVWRQAGDWQKMADFTDFVRAKSPIQYQKVFHYLDEETVSYALFHQDLPTARSRFAEAVAQPVEAIDMSLKRVFPLLSAHKDDAIRNYTKEVAATIWKPIKESPELLEGGEFDYKAYLYCDLMEQAFAKIKADQAVDWEKFEQEAKAIDFAPVKELSLLPHLDLSIDFTKFHTKPKYKDEQLRLIGLAFCYEAHATLGIPVYWAFSSWINVQQYLLDVTDASNRENWFSFTPDMIDKMGNKMMGFLGENKSEMAMTYFTFPYLYDFLLQKHVIDQELYDKLMNYYQFSRRALLETLNNEVWQFLAIYDWKKPNAIPTAQFEAEKVLLQKTITLSNAEATKAIQQFLNELPPLPKDATPSPPPTTIFDRLNAAKKRSAPPKKAPNPNRAIARKKRKKKKRR